MKYAIILLLSVSGFIICKGQGAKHIPPPAAKILLDTAASKYQRSGGDPDKIKEILSLLELAIKKDSLFYDAWSNKMTLQCQLGQFDNALVTIRRMQRIFPKEADAMLVGGVLEYHAGHKKEAQACFSKLLKMDNSILLNHEKDPKYKGVLINKGIVLTLLDNPEGKIILHRIYDAEKDPYVQSYIAFYINSSKEEIINDKIPGQ